MKYSNQQEFFEDQQEYNQPNSMFLFPSQIEQLCNLANSNTPESIKILQQILLSRNSFVWLRSIYAKSQDSTLDFYIQVAMKKFFMENKQLEAYQAHQFMRTVKMMIEQTNQYTSSEITTLFASTVGIFYLNHVGKKPAKTLIGALQILAKINKRPYTKIVILKIILEILDVLRQNFGISEKKILCPIIDKFLYIAGVTFYSFVINTDDPHNNYALAYGASYGQGHIIELIHLTLSVLKQCLEFDFFNSKRDFNNSDQIVESEFLEIYSPNCIMSKALFKDHFMKNYSLFRKQSFHKQLLFIYERISDANIKIQIMKILGALLRMGPKFFTANPKDVVITNAKMNAYLSTLNHIASCYLYFDSDQDVAILTEFGRTLHKSVILNKIQLFDQDILKELIVTVVQWFNQQFFSKNWIYVNMFIPYFQYFEKIENCQHLKSPIKNQIFSSIKLFRSRFLNAAMQIQDAHRFGTLDDIIVGCPANCVRRQVLEDILLNQTLLDQYLLILKDMNIDQDEQNLEQNQYIKIFCQYIKFNVNFRYIKNARVSEKQQAKSLKIIVQMIGNVVERIEQLYIFVEGFSGNNQYFYLSEGSEEISAKHSVLSNKSNRSKLISKIGTEQEQEVIVVNQKLNEGEQHKLNDSEQPVEQSKIAQKHFDNVEAAQQQPGIQFLSSPSIQSKPQPQIPSHKNPPRQKLTQSKYRINYIRLTLIDDQLLIKYRRFLSYMISICLKTLYENKIELPYDQIALQLFKCQNINFQAIQQLLVMVNQFQLYNKDLKIHITNIMTHYRQNNDDSDQYYQYIKLFVLVSQPEQIFQVMNTDIINSIPFLISILEIMHETSYHDMFDTIVKWFLEECYHAVVSFICEVTNASQIMVVGQILQVFALLLKINRFQNANNYKRNLLLEEYNIVLRLSLNAILNGQFKEYEINDNIQIFYFAIEELLNSSCEIFKMQNRLFSNTGVNHLHIPINDCIPQIFQILSINLDYFAKSDKRKTKIVQYLQTYLCQSPNLPRFIYDDNLTNIIIQCLPISLPFLKQYTQQPLMTYENRKQLIIQIMDKTMQIEITDYFDWINLLKFYKVNMDIANQIAQQHKTIMKYLQFIFDYDEINFSQRQLQSKQMKKIKLFKKNMKQTNNYSLFDWVGPIEIDRLSQKREKNSQNNEDNNNKDVEKERQQSKKKDTTQVEVQQREQTQDQVQRQIEEHEKIQLQKPQSQTYLEPLHDVQQQEHQQQQYFQQQHQNQQQQQNQSETQIQHQHQQQKQLEQYKQHQQQQQKQQHKQPQKQEQQQQQQIKQYVQYDEEKEDQQFQAQLLQQQKQFDQQFKYQQQKQYEQQENKQQENQQQQYYDKPALQKLQYIHSFNEQQQEWYQQKQSQEQYQKLQIKHQQQLQQQHEQEFGQVIQTYEQNQDEDYQQNQQQQQEFNTPIEENELVDQSEQKQNQEQIDHIVTQNNNDTTQQSNEQNNQQSMNSSSNE